MAFSPYTDNQLINHLLGPGSYAKPSLYLGLTVGGIEPATAGGTNYARQPCSFDITTNTASLHANVDFPVAGTNWGTIDGAAIYDAASGGNLLASGGLTTAKAIGAGDIFRAPAASITVSIT
jgi:hypothetical protein